MFIKCSSYPRALFGFVFQSRNALLSSTHELLRAAGCIYKQEKPCSNHTCTSWTRHTTARAHESSPSYSSITGWGLWGRLEHRGWVLVVVSAWKRPSATAFHQCTGSGGMLQPSAQRELQGCWERQGKATSKPCKSSQLCFGNREGDTVLLWHSLQAACGTDWFLFNYYYSSLGGCCTIYSWPGKTHAPFFEGKMAILSF